MKIKLTQTAGGHAAGDTIDVSDAAANHLIDTGYAEEVKPGRKKTDKDE